MKVKKSVLDLLFSHGAKELPYEACGYLAADNGVVGHHYEMTNTDKAADHFSMDPQEQFAVMKDIRKRGLQLRAVYHSHPETPARPSVEDIRLAYDPDVSYVIISFAGEKQTVKSFRIRNKLVEPEIIELVDD